MNGAKKLVVGLFTGGCLLLFALGLFLIGDSNQLFTKSFTAHADFSKITGVQNGGKVRVAGMDAGAVTRIEVPAMPGGKFRVYFRIAEKLHPIVRQDSIATIQTDGLLGNKFLEVDAGTVDSPLAQANGIIPSKEPFDWGDLMDEINAVVKQVNGIMEGVKDQVLATLEQIQQTVRTANGLIKQATPQVNSILASADKIASNLREIVDGVEEGKGTVGALFKDRALYDSVKRSAGTAEKVIENIRETSASVKTVATKFENADIVPEVKRTMENLQRITAQVQVAVEQFQSASGEGGVAENLQRTLSNANEAMSDLSDNTEALKHNFLFRGFFNKRGFFDLGSLTTPEYSNPKFGKGFKRHKVSIEAGKLFAADKRGLESLTPEGKALLDDAMTELLKFPRNGPLMVEGRASQGTPSQQYLTARHRAVLARTYLIARFHLRSPYVGVISMTGEPGGSVEGITVVTFYK